MPNQKAQAQKASRSKAPRKADLLSDLANAKRELRELEDKHIKLLEERAFGCRVWMTIKREYGIDDFTMFYWGMDNRLN